MTQFIRAANPIWWIPDLTGFPLNDQYYAFFLTNDLPYIPQPIYQDENGISPWANPLQFQPSGTLPNNLYFDDTLTYRIEIRQGNTSADPLIWLIENFVPGVGSGGNTDADIPFLDSDNMITNPQFADVYFQTPFTYVQPNPGSYSIPVGPGWRIDLTGSGSITLSQFPLSGSPATIGDPNYYLNINNTGWDTVKLIQRFSNTAAIFNNGAIAVAFTAVSSGLAQDLSVTYVPSSSTGQNIFEGTIQLGDFAAYGSAIDLTIPLNTQDPPAAFVDIAFNIFTPSDLNITNVQILGQTDILPETFVNPADAPIYQQITYERTVDHEFNVYQNSLLNQAKNNLLVGWTFGINPYQFINKTPAVVTGQTTYIADQTILYQETAGAIVSGQGPANLNYGLQLSSVNGVNANRFAIIQYIDATTMSPYWGQIVSSMVRAIWNSTVVGGLPAPQLKMRLIWRTSAVPILGNSEPITGFDPTTGDVIFAAGWNQIEPLNDVNYTLQNLSSPPSANTNEFPAMAFNKFQLPIPTVGSTPLYLGVVVYINKPLNNVLGNVDYVAFDRISLVPNDFAIDASPETFDENFRKCQFYYEKSLDWYVPPTSPTTFPVTYNGANSFNCPFVTILTTYAPPILVIQAQLSPKNFTLNYKCIKRFTNSALIPIFYSPVTGAQNAVSIEANVGTMVVYGPSDLGIVNWSAITGNSSSSYSLRNLAGVQYAPNAVPPNGSIEGIVYYHYTVDARLGIIL